MRDIEMKGHGAGCRQAHSSAQLHVRSSRLLRVEPVPPALPSTAFVRHLGERGHGHGARAFAAPRAPLFRTRQPERRRRRLGLRKRQKVLSGMAGIAGAKPVPPALPATAFVSPVGARGHTRFARFFPVPGGPLFRARQPEHSRHRVGLRKRQVPVAPAHHAAGFVALAACGAAGGGTRTRTPHTAHKPGWCHKQP